MVLLDERLDNQSSFKKTAIFEIEEILFKSLVISSPILEKTYIYKASKQVALRCAQDL